MLLGKVKVSGGGVCNVTMLNLTPRNLSKIIPGEEKELVRSLPQLLLPVYHGFFEKRGVQLNI